MADELKAIVFDGLTGKTVERDLNEQELVSLAEASLAAKKESEAEEAKLLARKSALAKLVTLGLTQEEIEAL